MDRPDQRSPTPPRPATRERIPQLFHNPQHSIGQEARKARVFLIPPGHPQPLHRPGIDLRTHVALRAVLMHNIPQPYAHDGARERHANGPVHVDTVVVVLACVAEVNEAALADRPGRCHAFTGLIGAEGLRRDDVYQPAGIEGFQGADDDGSDDVAECSRVQVFDQSVCLVRGLEAFLGVCETSLDSGAGTAHEVVGCVRAVVCEIPDAHLDEE